MSSESQGNATTTNKMVNILLADDHDIVRAGVKRLLADFDDFRIAGEAGDGEALLEKARQTPWDLIILDLSMPKLNGINALETLKNEFPERKVIILTLYHTEDYLRLALKKGADGYMLKDDVFENLVWSIREVMAGQIIVSPKLKSLMVDSHLKAIQEEAPLLEILSPREFTVLKLLAQGNTNKQIGKIMNLSHRTVEKHRAKVMEKLDFNSVAELTRYAVEQQLI